MKVVGGEEKRRTYGPGGFPIGGGAGKRSGICPCGQICRLFVICCKLMKTEFCSFLEGVYEDQSGTSTDS